MCVVTKQLQLRTFPILTKPGSLSRCLTIKLGLGAYATVNSRGHPLRSATPHPTGTDSVHLYRPVWISPQVCVDYVFMIRDPH